MNKRALGIPQNNQAVFIARIDLILHKTKAAYKFLVLLLFQGARCIENMFRRIVYYFDLVVLITNKLLFCGSVHSYFILQFLLAEVPYWHQIGKGVRI